MTDDMGPIHATIKVTVTFYSVERCLPLRSPTYVLIMDRFSNVRSAVFSEGKFYTNGGREMVEVAYWGIASKKGDEDGT